VGNRTIQESLDMLCGSFKRVPPQTYVDKLKQYLVHDLRLSIEDIEIVCRRLPEVVKTFPTRMDVKKVSDEIRKNKVSKSFHKPQTQRVEGVASVVPPHVMAMIEMIKDSRTEGGTFKGLIRRLGFSEDQAFQIYEAWVSGSVHPLVLEFKEKRMK